MKIDNYLESLWCAMYISEGWYTIWEKYKNSKDNHLRRLALKSKMISIIEYDRILNNYHKITPETDMGTYFKVND
jgi:hypothetical protein